MCGEAVLALGDTLTHGTGASPEAAYPMAPADNRLRSDPIHANARGSARSAQSVAAISVAAGLPVRR